MPCVLAIQGEIGRSWHIESTEKRTSKIMIIQLGTKHVRILQSPIWRINFIPNLVHYICTKFGTNFVIPLISLSSLKGWSKLLQSVLHHVLENDWSICILKIHSPYCVSSPCNNQMKTVVINHRTMLIIVQACAFNCAPCGVEWSQYHQNKWI